MYDPGVRSTLGDANVDSAVAALKEAAQNEARLTLHQPNLGMPLLRSMFSDEHIEIATRAKGVIEPMTRLLSYTFHGDMGGVTATVTIDWSELSLLPITSQNIQFRRDQYPEFYELVNELGRLQVKWGSVIHVLRWLNRNATAGAIRNLWPAAGALTKSPALTELVEAPTRWQAPPDVSKMLPLLRSTGAAVAEMAMMKKEEPRRHRPITIRTMQRQIMSEGDNNHYVDEMTFSL